MPSTASGAPGPLRPWLTARSTIPPVDVIVGPGNLFVTLAKKLVAGTVGIDMVAGPSEILIIADQTADAEFVAADMLSQAEHDPMASAVLLTTAPDLAQAVGQALDRQLDQLNRREIAAASIRDFGLIMQVPDLGHRHRTSKPHRPRTS